MTPVPPPPPPPTEKRTTDIRHTIVQTPCSQTFYFLFRDRRVERANENKNRRGFIDHRRRRTRKIPPKKNIK